MPMLKRPSPAITSSKVAPKNPRVESPLAASSPQTQQNQDAILAMNQRSSTQISQVKRAQDTDLPLSYPKESYGPRESGATKCGSWAHDSNTSRMMTQPKEEPITPQSSSSVVSFGRLSQPYEESSRFAKIMDQCGVKLSNSAQQQSELSRAPPEVVQALTKLYEDSDRKDSFLDAMVEGFEQYVRLPSRLEVAVMPTALLTVGDGSDDVGIQSNADSVVRILLSVDGFQLRVAVVLLEKFGDMLERGNAGNPPKLKLLKMILDQFRYLDSVQAGEEICNRFLDLVPMCNEVIKADVMSLVPQFIDNTNRAEAIATRLQEFMATDKTILRLAWETLSNLPLSMEKLVSFRQVILRAFHQYGPNDKIAALKFLLDTAETAGEVDEVFQAIIELNFDVYFDDDARQNATSSRLGSQLSQRTKTVDSMAISVAKILESAFKYNKTLYDSAVRVENQACSRKEKDHVLDVFIILTLFSARRGRPILNLIRQKVRNRCWTLELLNDCFNYPEVMTNYDQRILDIADDLICASEKRFSTFGAKLYQHLFLAANEMQKQEMIGKLVAHACSGQELEVNAAIDALEMLCSSTNLAEYGTFLEGILDNLMPLRLYQIRRIFALFGRLTTQNGDGMSLDELHIFIRKAIGCSSLRLKAIGILAALTLFKAGKESTKELSLELYKVANKCSKGHHELRILFCDEMSNAVQQGDVKDTKLLGELKTTLFQTLESNFIMNNIQGREWRRLCESGTLVGVASCSKRSFALKLLSDNDHGGDAQQKCDASSAVLPSLLRLFLSCQWQATGSFDDVDLLLESPILLNNQSNWSRIEHLPTPEQAATCMELLHSGNCLIELLNGLSRLGVDGENCKIMLNRLEDLVKLEEEFQRCVELSPCFTLPVSELDRGVKKVRQAIKKPANEGKKGTKKNNGCKSTQQTLCGDLLKKMVGASSTQKSTQAEQDEAGTSRATIKNFKDGADYGCFRDLDLPIFLVLKSESSHREEVGRIGEPHLTPSVLAYILSKLLTKIRNLMTVTAVGRGAAFMKKTGKNEPLNSAAVDTLNEQLKILAPEIWKHVLYYLNYFKELSDTNDGVVDGGVSRNRDSLMIGRCVKLGLGCFTGYLKWLSDNDTRSSLCNVLASISTNAIRSTQSDPLESHMRSAVSQLLEFADFIPTLNLAVDVLNGASALVKLYEWKNPASEDEAKIAKIADEYLKREWDLEETTSSGVNNGLASAVELALSIPTAAERMESFKQLTKAVAVFLDKQSVAGIEYKSITKGTLFTWYRTVFMKLASEAKSSPTLAKSAKEAERATWLEHWGAIGAGFRLLSCLVKRHPTRPMLAAGLVHSCTVLTAFTTKAIPALENKMLERFSLDNIKDLISAFKTSSMAMNDICVEAKANKQQRALLKLLPPAKRTLENFVFRMKALMAANNCAEALTIGLLKNRDLAGVIHSSQASQRSSDCDENETEDGQMDEQEVNTEDDEQEDVAVANDNDDYNEIDEDDDNSGNEESENGNGNNRESIDSDAISDVY